MKALALLVVLSLGYVPRAYAADDAPLLEAAMVEEAMDLKCYDAQQRANIAAQLESQRAKIKSLEGDAGKPNVLALVLVGVLSIAVGGAIGFGVAKATAPKP